MTGDEQFQEFKDSLPLYMMEYHEELVQCWLASRHETVEEIIKLIDELPCYQDETALDHENNIIAAIRARFPQ